MNRAKLVYYRKIRGLTQQELADKSGFSRNSIMNWETGKRNPKIGDIEKIAKVLDVSPFELFDNNDVTMPENITKKATRNLSYWSALISKTNEVLQRGDKKEISLVKNFLATANALLSLNDPEPPATIQNSGVVMDNLNHNDFSGASIIM